MRKIKLSLALLIICLFTFAFSSIFIYAETTENYTINDVKLYNQTNTYDYILEEGSETTEHNFNNEARYNLIGNKNGNVVSTAEPSITVFTHGWKGTRTNFLDSNPDNGNESLVTKFNKVIYDSYIYVAQFNVVEEK